MLRKLVATTLLLVASLSMTACDTGASMTDIEKGKACFDSGGSWIPDNRYNQANKMICEFRQENS